MFLAAAASISSYFLASSPTFGTSSTVSMIGIVVLLLLIFILCYRPCLINSLSPLNNRPPTIFQFSETYWNNRRMILCLCAGQISSQEYSQCSVVERQEVAVVFYKMCPMVARLLSLHGSAMLLHNYMFQAAVHQQSRPVSRSTERSNTETLN